MNQPEIESRLQLLSEPGRATVGRVRDELSRNNVPVISQILRIIKDLSDKPEILSVNELVDFISHELTTMSQVISAANTMGYNTHGVQVVSIHHAVSVIGFNRVRSLAISILLLENAQSKSTAETNRELAGAALISGLVAAEVCRLGAIGEPEVAFICGALRDYGRMLAATFLPVEYAVAEKLAPVAGPDRSFDAAFGLPSLELGREVLLQLNIPAAILRTFETVSRLPYSGGSANPPDRLAAVADFGLHASQLLRAPDLNNENFEARFVALSEQYDLPVRFRRAEARQLVHHLSNVLEGFRAPAGSYIGSVLIFRRVNSLAAARPLPTAISDTSKSAPVAKPPGQEAEVPPNYDI